MTTPAARRPLRERLRGAGMPAVGGLRGFGAWWGRSLLAWLPLAWRQALGMDRGRLLLQPQAGGVRLLREDAHGLRELALLPMLDTQVSAMAALTGVLAPSAHDLPRWLLLPAQSALRRRMPLPVAAADRLRDVVGFEIDRQTPFTADAVAYDARVLGRREGDQQLDVELVAVPCTVVDMAEAALGDLAANLAGIDVLDADSGLTTAGAAGAEETGATSAGTARSIGVNLLAPARRRQQADPLRKWNLVLAAIALIATAAMLWQLLENRREAADAFQQVADQRARAARSVSTQRQELAAIVDGQAFLDSTRAGRPTVVEVLNDLSRRLPDNTYVERLAIEGERITLIGRSAEAPALLGRLEGSPLWRAPALAGALQQDPRSGRDIFTITADLVTPPEQAPAKSPSANQEPTRDAGE